MENKNLKDALENIAKREVPQNINLWANIESKLIKTENYLMKARLKFSTSFLMALAALIVFSGAAYAYIWFAGTDSGLQGVDEQNLITDIESSAQPEVFITPPVATPISNWFDDLTAPAITVVAQDAMQSANVTVNWAYADESRFAVRFTISGLNLPKGLEYNYGAGGTFSIKDRNGTIFGTNGFSTAAENREDGSVVVTANYYGGLDAGVTPQLDLDMTVQVGGFSAPYTDPSVPNATPEMRAIPLLGESKFQFSIPVYDGIDVEVNQTVETNNLKMRLVKLTVNRSHTDAVICFEKPSSKGWDLSQTILKTADGAEYSYDIAAHAITDNVAKDYKPDRNERCEEIGFNAPHDGNPTRLKIRVPYLLASVSGYISTGRIDLANEKLKDKGIELAYLNTTDFTIVRKPEGMEDWEVNQLFWDALADHYYGPWEFVVDVNP